MPLGGVGGQFADEGLVDADQDVLRFDVRVDYVALGVQVVQPLQYLLLLIIHQKNKKNKVNHPIFHL